MNQKTNQMTFTLRIKILVLCTLLFVIGGCKDEEPEQNNVRPDALTANFNGQAIDFAYFPEASDIEVADSNLTGMFIRGETEDFSRSLTIALMPFTGTGQYVIDQETSEEEMDTFHYMSSPPGGGVLTSYSTLDGLTITVTITQFNGESLKGTYSGEIKCIDCNGNIEAITIANGVIDLEYVGSFY